MAASLCHKPRRSDGAKGAGLVSCDKATGLKPSHTIIHASSLGLWQSSVAPCPPLFMANKLFSEVHAENTKFQHFMQIAKNLESAFLICYFLTVSRSLQATSIAEKLVSSLLNSLQNLIIFRWWRWWNELQWILIEIVNETLCLCASDNLISMQQVSSNFRSFALSNFFCFSSCLQSKCNKFGAVPTLNQQEGNVSGE